MASVELPARLTPSSCGYALRLTSLAASSDAWLASHRCHNGDLYPTFNSGAFALGQGPRDNNDVVHAALVSDSWASFMRTGQPNPDVAYLRARGYDTAISRMWQPTTTANPQMLSLGPAPRMIPLTQRGEHCTVLGKPLNYVALGG